MKVKKETLSAEKRLANRQNSGEEAYEHVDASLPIVEGLRPLQEVLSSIREKMDSIAARKRRILEELLYLLNNWDEYTQDESMVAYAGENGLYRFLGEKIVDQTISTSYADIRIVRMLQAYRAAHLLTLDNKVQALKRIAYVSDKRNPERAERFRQKMINDLPQLSNKQVNEAVDEFNRGKGEVLLSRPKYRRPWELAISPNRGKIAIKEMKPDTVRQLGRLLSMLTEEKMGKLINELQRENGRSIDERVEQKELVSA